MNTNTGSITYRVDGMTCDHCATAVAQELTSLAGVDGVMVDVDAGTVVVDGPSAGDESTIAAGVDEAGYTLVGRDR